jgi:hypothetical protein
MKLAQFRIFGHITRVGDESYLKMAWQGRLQKKRPWGRPRQTWEERKRFWRKEVDWNRVRAAAWDHQRQKTLSKPSAHTGRRASTKWSEVFTFCGWFHLMRMRRHSWHACFRHSCAIMENIPSLVMLHLPWSEVGCCLDLWNVTVLQTFKGFYSSKMCPVFYKN